MSINSFSINLNTEPDFYEIIKTQTALGLPSVFYYKLPDSKVVTVWNAQSFQNPSLSSFSCVPTPLEKFAFDACYSTDLIQKIILQCGIFQYYVREKSLEDQNYWRNVTIKHCSQINLQTPLIGLIDDSNYSAFFNKIACIVPEFSRVYYIAAIQLLTNHDSNNILVTTKAQQYLKNFLSFSHGVDTGSDQRIAHILISIIHYKTQQQSTALQYLNRMLPTEQSPLIQTFTAVLYRNEGKCSLSDRLSAENYLTRAHKQDPRNPYTNFYLGMHWILDSYPYQINKTNQLSLSQVVEKMFMQVVESTEIPPEFQQATYFNLALLLYNRQKDFFSNHHTSGSLSSKSFLISRIKNYLKIALKLEPSDLSTLLFLGFITLHEDNNDDKKAEQYFKKILSIDSNNQEALLQLGYMCSLDLCKDIATYETCIQKLFDLGIKKDLFKSLATKIPYFSYKTPDDSFLHGVITQLLSQEIKLQESEIKPLPGMEYFRK